MYKRQRFEFGQQGDGDGKFKVDIGERGTTMEDTRDVAEGERESDRR